MASLAITQCHNSHLRAAVALLGMPAQMEVTHVICCVEQQHTHVYGRSLCNDGMELLAICILVLTLLPYYTTSPWFDCLGHCDGNMSTTVVKGSGL